jgi:hypothetical protein
MRGEYGLGHVLGKLSALLRNKEKAYAQEAH